MSGRLVVWSRLHRKVLPLGKCVGESLLGIDIHHSQSDFILAAIPPSVEDKFAIAARIFKSDAGGVIGAPGKGINQQLVFSVQRAANIELHQVLIGQPLAEKIASPSFHRRFKGIGVEQLTESFAELRAAWEIRKRSGGTFLFGVHPCARLRALLVLQPAVGVSYDRGAVGVLRRINSRHGRTLRWRTTLLPSRTTPNFHTIP